MRTAQISASLVCVVGLQLGGLPAETNFQRYLPEAYVPGETTGVLLEAEPPMSRLWADVCETIPPRWSFVGSDPPAEGFDQDSGTIRWSVYFSNHWGWLFADIRYYVQPPLDQRGDVSFEGHSYYAFDEDAPRTYAATTGDATLSERVGMLRFRPHWATIQATIDASEWGDSVMVSADGSPYAENIVMKRGVNLVGFVEWPSYEPPVLQSASPSDPAIVAAPYTSIRGFIISSSSCGIRVNDPTVEISQCVITGTENAAVEYVGVSEGRVTNCTIAGNSGVGVLCHESSPEVVISNCILFGNAGKDAENCTVRFCLVEDEIEDGLGRDNISGDPIFVNPAAGDYRLLPGSPCIDAGDNNPVSPEDTDILGNPRIMFGGKSETVDMGAYEYWFISAARQADTGNVEISWATQAGRTYSVFFSEDLVDWQLAEESVPSAGSITTWLDPPGALTTIPVRFYRVTQSE